MLEQPMRGREIDPGFAVGGVPLVVARQAPTMSEPAEEPLHDPAMGQRGKAGLPRGLAHDLHGDAVRGFQFRAQFLALVTIAPQQHQQRIARGRELTQQQRAIPIRHLRGQDQYRQQMAFHIHHHVAFAPLQSLPAVPADRLGRFRGLDRLAIDNPGGGLRVPPQPPPTLFPQAVRDGFQRAVRGPLDEVVVPGGARRQIVRQVAPGAARLLEVQECVHDLAQWDGCGAPWTARFAFPQQRLQQRPLGVGQVTRVRGAARRARLGDEPLISGHPTTRRLLRSRAARLYQIPDTL